MGFQQAEYSVKLYAWNGNRDRELSMDASTWAINTIDYAHHEVHGGSAYWVANNATLGNGELNTISLTTPDTTKWAHLLLQIDSGAVGVFDVLEDVTSLASGAASTPLNFNRNSAKTSVLTAKVGDTPGADPIVPTIDYRHCL